MNETICNVMLFGGIALAVVFAVIAVILFVKLDIPKVIGDLSGSTARKQIKEIREKGYESLQEAVLPKKMRSNQRAVPVRSRCVISRASQHPKKFPGKEMRDIRRLWMS